MKRAREGTDQTTNKRYKLDTLSSMTRSEIVLELAKVETEIKKKREEFELSIAADNAWMKELATALVNSMDLVPSSPAPRSSSNEKREVKANKKPEPKEESSSEESTKKEEVKKPAPEPTPTKKKEVKKSSSSESESESESSSEVSEDSSSSEDVSSSDSGSSSESVLKKSKAAAPTPASPAPAPETPSPVAQTASDKIIYCANLDFTITEPQLREAINCASSTIIEPQLNTKGNFFGFVFTSNSSHPDSVCHLKCATASEAAQLMKLNGSSVLGRKVRMAFYAPK